MISTKKDNQESHEAIQSNLNQNNMGQSKIKQNQQQISLPNEQSIDKQRQILLTNFYQPVEIKQSGSNKSFQKFLGSNKPQFKIIYSQECPKICQKNTLSIQDRAKVVKNDFLKYFDIFMDQIQNFEDQYYSTQESVDQYHPNCLADDCLEKIKQITDLIQKTSKKIEMSTGNTIKSKFHFTDYIQSQTEFESLKRLEYSITFEQCYYQTIVAYDCSFQDKFLACCYSDTIALIDLKQHQEVGKINHLREISAIKYYEDDSFNFIVGDSKGFIAKYNTQSQQKLYLNQLHTLTICQILIKDNSSIFTCSLDNTIKLTNIEQFQIIMAINYKCSCFSGFDYSQNFLIAPNNSKYLSIWDGSSGKEIVTKSFGFEEDRFISIQLSSNSKQAIVNLFNQFTILLLDIKFDLQEIILIKVIKLHKSDEKCVNMSWCLNDTSFVYFHQTAFEIRNLKQKNIPLLFREVLNSGLKFPFQRGFVNKLNKELNYLVAVFNDVIYINERRIKSHSLAK